MNNLSIESEVRMIISHIVEIILLISVISLSGISSLIFGLETKEENRAGETTHQEHAKTNTITYRIAWCLCRNENIAGYDAAGISKTDLHCSCYAALVVTCDVLWGC